MSSRVMNMTLSFGSPKALSQKVAQARRVGDRGFTLPTKTGKSSPIKKTYQRSREFSAKQLGHYACRTPQGINLHTGLPKQSDPEVAQRSVLLGQNDGGYRGG